MAWYNPPMDLLAELTRLNPDPALLDGVKKLLGDAQNKDLKIQQLTTSCDLEVLKNHKLTLELAYYKRLRFGVRNEALTAEQRHLFDDDTDQDLAAIEVELETPATSIRTPRIRAGRQPLPEHLTRIEIRHEPETCTCAQCQSSLVKIGEDISEQLDIEPARFFVRRHIRPQYACRQCQTVTAAAVEPAVINGGMAAPGLLAWVATSKYLDHLPLYRLEQIAARQNVSLARSTLSEWIGRIGFALQPLADRLAQHLRQRASLHADETPVQQLDPGKGKTQRAYLWAYRSNDLDDGPPLVVFDYQSSRSGKHAAAFLEGWRGTLMVDDYSGYKALFAAGLAEQACWAHARRKFFDLDKGTPQGHPIAAEVLSRIARLYEIEAQGKGKSQQARKALREQAAMPELERLHERLSEIRQKAAPGYGLAKACDYILRRWSSFSRYAQTGELPIDNNPVENAIRPIALGKKNWLFAGSERAGRRAAAIQSLLATAKLNGLDPAVWLKTTLERLPSCLNSRIDELLPIRR